MEIKKNVGSSQFCIAKKTDGKYLWGNKTEGNYLLSMGDTFTKSSTPDDSLFIPGGKDIDRWRTSESQRQYKLKLREKQFKYAKIGGFIGGLVCGKTLPGLVGGVVAGAAMGAYMAWDKVHDEDRGKITVNIDGEKFIQPYYMDPYTYEKSPELQKALEEKQEKISPPKSNITGNIDETGLEQLKPFAGKLVDLGKTRRLLADFGEKSLQGKEVLQLIDSNKAKELIAAGLPVFVVNGTDVSETPRKYSANADNKARTVALNEVHDLLEKQIDYTLSEIKSPEELADVKDGKGVPEGLQGVYKDGSSYKEIVYNKAQQGFLEIRQSSKEKKVSNTYSMSENSKVDDPGIKTAGDVRPGVGHYKNLGFYLGLGTFMTVGLAGTFCSAVPPALVPALEIGGAVIAYNIGKQLMKNQKVMGWMETRR